jgi:hypothetical protein
MHTAQGVARVCRASVASLALVAVAGCGSQSAQGSSVAAATSQPVAAASAARPHACTVITEQEVTAALGADKGAGQESAPGVPGVGDCVYGATTGAGVRLTVDASGVGKAIYDGDRSSYPAGSSLDLSRAAGGGSPGVVRR